MSNFSKYIDWVISNTPDTFKNVYWYQCVSWCKAIAEHLGYPITSVGNAWDIYVKGSKGYIKKEIGSYIPLPWDFIFMKPNKANWMAGHIACADIGCTMARYNVIHQNYWVQWASGSGKGDRHLKRQSIPAQQFWGIFAREIPFEIK